MHTSATSGRSNPSRKRFTPTITSYVPFRNSEDFKAFDRVNTGMKISRFDVLLDKIFREIFRHFFRERRHKHAIAAPDFGDASDRIVNL